MVYEVKSKVESFIIHCDAHNHYDPFAIAMCKGTTVVGHVVLRKISVICYVFWGRHNKSVRAIAELKFASPQQLT